MISRIVHTADWHLHHKDYHRRFEETQDLLAKSIEANFNGLSYDERLIVITGDLFDFKDKITQSNEAFSLMSKALHRLTEIARVVITIGNHDYSVNNKGKLDCITPIVENFEMLGNNNITYFKHTKCSMMDNIVFCNFSNFDGNKRPPIESFRKMYPTHKFIGLFHDIISGAKNFQGRDLTDESCLSTNHFEWCDVVMMGDIHKHQQIDNAVYAGSLNQLNFGETVNGHGYCLWNVDDLSYQFIELQNGWGKYKLTVKSFEDVDNDKEIFTNLGKGNDEDIKTNSEFSVEWEDYYFNMGNSKLAELEEKFAKKYNVPKSKVTAISNYIQTFTSSDGQSNVSNVVLDTVLNPKKLRDTYAEFISDRFKDQNTDKFFEIDREVLAKLPPLEKFDIRNRKYKLLYIKGKNIFSFGEFYRDFSKAKGLNVVYSDPSNQGGKSKFTMLPAFLLFGNNIKLNTNNVTFANVFNYAVAEKDAYIEGELEIDGTVFYLRRELRKTKSGVSHKFFLFKYDEKEGTDCGLRLPAVNLTIKDAVQTLADFKKYIGTYEDYVFSSYYEYHSIDKWVHTKKTERYRLFCEYLGLGLLDSKYKISNAMLNTFGKTSLLGKNNKETVIQEQTKSKESLSDTLSKITDFVLKIRELGENCTKIQTQINQKYEQKIPLDSKFQSLDISVVSQEIKDLLERVVKADEYIQSLAVALNHIEFTDFSEQIATLQQDVQKFENQIKAIEIPQSLKNNLEQYQKDLTNVNLTEEQKRGEENAKELVDSLILDKFLLEDEIKRLEKSLSVMSEIICKKCGHVENGQDDKTKISADISLKSIELKNKSVELLSVRNCYTDIQDVNALSLREKMKSINERIDVHKQEITTFKDEFETRIREQIKSKHADIERCRTYMSQETQLENARDKRKNLLDKIDLLNSDVKKFYECQNSLETNAKLSVEIKALETEFFSNNEQLQILKNRLMELEKESAVLEHKISGNSNLLVKLEEESKYEQALRLYVQVHGDDGLGKHIITSVLPQINQDLAILMGGLCDFDLQIQFDEKEIEFVTIKGKMTKDLYTGSGYETTMSCLALHYVNCRMSTLPLPNYLVMDEIFGRVNPDNIKNVINLLQKLCEIFDTIDIVTHTCTDEILASIDNHILIEKTNDISRIVNHN